MRIFRALKPIIVKEFRQVRRDPTSLGMLLVLPAALIVFVGYALNFDVKHIPLAIHDQDNSAQSREFLKTFKQTEYFEHLYTVSTYREIEELVDKGRAKIAVVIPLSFSKDLSSGNDTRVQFLVDGSDANSANQAVGYAMRIAGDYSRRLASEALFRKGREFTEPVDFQPRVWYNADLVSSKFLVPGLIGLILVLTAVVSTSMTIVREKERGTMEQIMVSPVRPVELILGKTVPYMIISLLAATMILLLGYLLFDIKIMGSIALLYAGIFLLLLGGLGQGLLISTVTNSQQVAFIISIFSSLLPSFLLSGFIFPISSMPVVLQILSNAAVTKFFLIACRAIILKGTGFSAIWDQFLYLAIFAFFMMAVSSRRMQKRTL